MAEAGWADRVGQVRVWMDATGTEVVVIARGGSVVMVTAATSARHSDFGAALDGLASLRLSGRMLYIGGTDAGRMLALAELARARGAALVAAPPGDGRFDL